MRKIQKQSSARDRMVEVALELFHQHGVHATSVDAILKKSKTGKSQFAHYFKDKEGLVTAALEHFYHLVVTGKIPATAPIHTWKELQNWFNFFIDWQEKIGFSLGCPIATIGSDLSGPKEAVREKMRAIFNLRRAPLVEFFSKEQKRQALSREVSADALADFCYTITQGGLMMAKVEHSNIAFRHAIDSALHYLKSLRIESKS